MSNELDKKIKIDLSVRDALRIMFVLAKTNGRDGRVYMDLSRELDKFGDIDKTLTEFTSIDGAARLNYYNVQDDVENKFLSIKKNQKEINKLENKVKMMLAQIEDLKNAQ